MSVVCEGTLVGTLPYVSSLPCNSRVCFAVDNEDITDSMEHISSGIRVIMLKYPKTSGRLIGSLKLREDSSIVASYILYSSVTGE